MRFRQFHRVRSGHALAEAMLETLEPASEYERVRTAQGRTAHLRLRGASPGVLCGWPGPWVPAEPDLLPCRLCGNKAGAS
jgi:hypothetical protein